MRQWSEADAAAFQADTQAYAATHSYAETQQYIQDVWGGGPVRELWPPTAYSVAGAGAAPAALRVFSGLVRGKTVFGFLGAAVGLGKKAIGGIGHLLHKKGKQMNKAAMNSAVASGGAPSLLSQGLSFVKQHKGAFAGLAGGSILAGGAALGMHMRKGKLSGATAGFGGRRRRMRVTNPKALRRAIRRVYSAEKMYRKLFSVTHRAPAGHIRAKAPKRHRGRFAA